MKENTKWDSLFNKPLPKEALEKLRREYALPPKDHRLRRLDPNSAFYQDGVDLLKANPRLEVEELKAMAAPVGFTIDLLPEEK